MPIMVRPPGFEPGSSAWQARRIDYRGLREDFIEFLKSRNLNRRYIHCIISYLDKYVKVISEPMDVVRIFSGLSPGQQHNLNRAIRNLFNFLEAQGFNEVYLSLLRKNIPRDHVGVDLKVPEESDIIKSLRKLPKAPEKYVALYNLLLDSGLRLVEGIMLIERFNPDKCERLSGFYRFPIGEFRGSKQAYYAYFTEVTHKEITKLNGKNKSGFQQRIALLQKIWLCRTQISTQIRIR